MTRPISGRPVAGWPARIVTACAVFAGALGVTVMLAWYTHSNALLQLGKGNAAMAYNTAFAFAAGAAALLALLFGARRLAAACGGFLIALGAAVLYEYAFSANLGIDQFLMHAYNSVATPHPGRLAPNTAAAFVLFGFCVLVSARVRFAKRDLLTGSGGAVIASVGFIPLLGYLFRVPVVYVWAGNVQMAVHTAAGMIALGAGLMALSWGGGEQKVRIFPPWLPVAVATGVLSITVMVWQALRADSAHRMAQLVDAQSLNVRLLLKHELEERTYALRLLARTADMQGLRPASDWEQAAAAYRDRRHGYDAVCWIPFSMGPECESARPELLRGWTENRAPGGARVTETRAPGSAGVGSQPEVATFGNPRRMTMLIPLGTDHGAIAGLLDVQAFVADALNRGLVTRYAVSIQDELGPVYEIQTDDRAYASRAPEVTLPVGGSVWRIKVWPRPATVSQLSNSLPETVLVLGMLIAGILAAATRLLLLAQAGAAESRISGDRMQAEIALRDQVEHALRESEERFRQVTDSIQEVFWLSDPTISNFLYLSPAYERVWGRSCRSCLENPAEWVDSIHPEDRARFAAAVENLSSGELDEEIRIVLPDRSVHWISARAVPVRNEQGRFYRVAGVAKDITHRKELEDSFRHAKTEAEQASRAKSHFISRMSHELRTPLNAILGFTQVMEMNDPPRSTRERLAHIMRAGRHLLNLIDEILDISRIEAGRLALSPEPVSVEDALSRALEMMLPIAEKQGSRIVVKSWPDPDLHVFADVQRLQQVLLNLLTNAIKYGGAGEEITLTADVTPEGRVRFLVTDRGPGISKEDCKRLFAPFERLNMENEGIEGTGLGLAVSKSLTEAMGGSIVVESEPGRGSTFRAEFAAAKSPLASFRKEQATVRTRPAQERGAWQVLYIEDNVSNIRLMQDIVEQRPNIALAVAVKGEAGLQRARQDLPDLILLDLHLPDISGEVVLERLKADSATAAIPVIMVTADASPRQVTRLTGAGAVEYVKKPIDVMRLLEIIDRVLLRTAEPVLSCAGSADV